MRPRMPFTSITPIELSGNALIIETWVLGQCGCPFQRCGRWLSTGETPVPLKVRATLKVRA